MQIFSVTNKKVGVWGLGITGRSLIKFLADKAESVFVLEKKELSADDRALCERLGVVVLRDPDDREKFLSTCEIIIPSPGIDVRKACENLFDAIKEKCIPELDLFYYLFKKPIVAITGSLGKTTITTLLAKALTDSGRSVAVGGNIGIGLFDLLEKQDELDCVVLEVSSFQLELCRLFVPTVALWTNLHPNHLDRHATFEDYANAKKKIYEYQAEPHVIAPLRLLAQLGLVKGLSQSCGNVCIANTYNGMRLEVVDGTVVMQTRDSRQMICSVEDLGQQGFIENWLMVIAGLVALGVDLSKIKSAIDVVVQEEVVIEHRLEYVATVSGVDFINDSKATVVQATQAAVNRLCDRPLILLLGGLSKGVNRRPFVAELSGRVAHVVCFGGEASDLYRVCCSNALCATSCETLEEALDCAVRYARPGYRILLSPAGSSFDLFSNYMDRGKRFKQLVELLAR
jgi:UDP-N-acetylmuramoylalanine--D-glutamate ligase